MHCPRNNFANYGILAFLILSSLGWLLYNTQQVGDIGVARMVQGVILGLLGCIIGIIFGIVSLIIGEKASPIAIMAISLPVAMILLVATKVLSL
jgi:hypothetical protein